ncbi:MAG: diaminopimelate epimerase [Leptotrichiaceae bacterium]
MVKFEKYQGLGNDFIIVSERELIDKGIPDYNEFAELVCDRHFGIGADGLLILKYVANMPFMFYYNSDGSQAPMCGNGIRCFAHYIKNNKIEEKDTFTVKVVPGDLTIETHQEEDGEFWAKVNMGKPIFNVNKIINSNKEELIKEKIVVNNQEVEISYIFMGTDHAVIFVDNLSNMNIPELGSAIENYTEIFPKKTNVNFAHVKDRNNIEIITWERGAGLTLACGTGATATAVIANYLGMVDNKVNVKVPGGMLVIDVDGKDSEAFMTGPSEKIAEGYYVVKR